MKIVRPGLGILAGLAAIASAAVLFGAAGAVAAAGTPPNSMASMGDSISRAFNACGLYVDCLPRSFTTGDDPAVNSEYRRILAVNPAIAGHAFNDAKSGAKVADMPGQAATAVSQRVDYVTILIGANDACTSSESTMTPVSTFRQSVDTTLSTLKAGLPAARVLLVSIPDLKRLWAVGKDTATARDTWTLFGICQSMLANPASAAPADNARRDRVRQRVVDFNAALAAACTAYGANCVFDRNATFAFPFTLAHLSTWDYFHPNTAGQAVLARLAYTAGADW
jgi:lysophospholipase L1-like esterase